MTKKIIGVPGAFSTPTIFNYLQITLCDYEWACVDYGANTDTFDQAQQFVGDFLSKEQDEFHLVGHSMGGMLALCCANNPKIASITTIASPLGGLEYSFWQHWFNNSCLVGDLYYFSQHVKKIHNQNYTQPVQHLLTIQGYNPYMSHQNDGVISLNSQRAWHAGTVHEITSNHAEVMLNPQTAQLLDDFWKTHD